MEHAVSVMNAKKTELTRDQMPIWNTIGWFLYEMRMLWDVVRSPRRNIFRYFLANLSYLEQALCSHNRCQIFLKKLLISHHFYEMEEKWLNQNCIEWRFRYFLSDAICGKNWWLWASAQTSYGSHCIFNEISNKRADAWRTNTHSGIVSAPN